MAVEIPGPGEMWKDNPYLPGSRNLKAMLDINRSIPGLKYATEQVAAKAQFMLPTEVMAFNEWAKAHPTMDPEAWVPLAQHGISPYSIEGMAAANQDVTNQVASGTYGVNAGTATSDVPVQHTAPDTETTDDSGGFSLGIPDWVASPIGWSRDFVFGSEDPDAPSISGFAKTVIRAELTALAAPIQGEVAAARNVLGEENKRNQLWDIAAERYGISEGARNQVNVAGPFWERTDFDPNTLEGGPEEVANLAKAQEFVNKRLAKYGQKQPGILDQTELGQVVRSYTDDQVGNLLTGKPIDGSVFDPKSKKWLNPKTGELADWETESGLLPSKFAQQQSEWAAIQSYDMRTMEEKAQGLAPVAWTPGRGIAHNYFTPSETGFYVMSGIVDSGVNLFGDPINLVPIGKVGNIARSATSGGRALLNSGDNLVVLTRGAQMAGVETLKAPAGMIRTGARGTMASQMAREGVETVLDPSMAARGYTLSDNGMQVLKPLEGIDDAGRVVVPHSKMVLNKNAWQWLQSGRGARIVEELAKEKSVSTIIRRSNGNFDVNLARRIAMANNPEEVRAVLASRMGIDITRVSEWGALGGRGQWIGKLPIMGAPLAAQRGIAGKELAGGAGLVTKQARAKLADNYEQFGTLGAARSLYRGAFRMSPQSGGGFDLEDLDQTYRETTNFLDGARMLDAETSAKVDELMWANNGVERYEMLYGPNGILDIVNKRLTAQFNMPPEVSSKITRAFAGGLNPAERRYVNTGMGDAAFGAESGTVGRAMLLNEQLSHQAMLPNYRTMRRATGIMANIYRLPDPKLRAAAVADAANGLTSVWRNLTLVRGAYVLREAGEMAFAMSLAGGDGMFTHPFQFAAHAMVAASALEVTTAPGRIFKGAITMPVKGGRIIMDRSGRLMVAVGGDAVKKSLDDYMADLALHTDDGVDPVTRAVRSVTMDSETGSTKFRDLTRGEMMQVAKVIDKDALRDWLLLQQGMAGLMPRLDPRWARINGFGMFDELNQMKEYGGARVRLSAAQEELNTARGYLAVDEPAGREATRLIVPKLREQLADRREYVDAHIANRLFPLSQDPTMRMLADPDTSFEEVFAVWHASKTQALQARMRPDLLPVGANSLAPSEDAAREYLYGYQRLLNSMTGGDEALLGAVRSGKFADEAITTQNKALRRYLASRMEDDNFRPMMPEQNFVAPFSGTLAGGPRKFVNWFFEVSGEFSDIVTRAPYVREMYAERVLQLAPYMTYEAKSQAVANLRRAGDLILANKIQKIKVNKTGTLGIDEIEIVAQQYARAKSAEAFYNAHRRQNWAVAMRVFTPFAQATFNTFKRWGMFSMKHPQMLYRTMKPIEALTDPGSAVVYEAMGALFGDEAMQALYTPGAPEASVDGFFYTNEYGDRLFSYPLIGRLAELIPFIDAPPGTLATSPWQNLNVAGTSFNPGTGPLLTLPASMMFNETINKDSNGGEILRAAFPYGLPTDDNPIIRGIQSILPTTLRRAVPTEDQQATLQIRLIPQLLATGDYDVTKKSDVQRLLSDAKTISGRMAFFGMITGSFTPSTTQWSSVIDVSAGAKAVAEAKPGVQTLMLQDRLSQEYLKYIEPFSEATAWEDFKRGQAQFIHDYGYAAMLSILPRTETMSDSPVSTVTEDVWSWRSDNPDAYTKYRDVIALFFPGGDPYGDFSEGQRSMYAWQKATGERYVPKTEDWMNEANAQIGWILYGVQNAALIKAVPDPAAQVPIRATIQQNIMDKFPGWSPDPTEGGTFDKNIDILEEAVADPDVQGLAGTPYIDSYLKMRQRAVEDARWKLGGSGDLTTEAAAPIRASLYAYAQQLVTQDTSGTFAYAWSRFFSREFEE